MSYKEAISLEAVSVIQMIALHCFALSKQEVLLNSSEDNSQKIDDLRIMVWTLSRNNITKTTCSQKPTRKTDSGQYFFKQITFRATTKTIFCIN